MKTLKCFLLLTIMMFLSCEKEPSEPIIPGGNVSVTLDYTFSPKGKDITPKGAATYIDFYNKYIESKALTPKTYSINFYGINNKTAQTIMGKWGDKALVSLAPDKYEVTGISRPRKYAVCGDTAYLEFHDTIEVTEASTNLLLRAYYDCSLILLDTTNVKSTNIFVADTTTWTFYDSYHNSVKKTMMKTEGFYHTFLFNGTANGVGYPTVNLYLDVTSRLTDLVQGPEKPPYLENRVAQFALWIRQWEAGKYYYFENTANGYVLTPMTNN